MHGKRLKMIVQIGLFCLVVLWGCQAVAAPSADLWPRWQTYDATSAEVVDHRLWNELLGRYVQVNPQGINRFRYQAVSLKDKGQLGRYLAQLQEIKVSTLNRQEQKALWINLYNALTVQVILNHYPVKSIMDIDISPGFFSNGPWGAKLLRIEGEKLSLNDIEHRILRPIFKDNRVHYGLNCASLGCPNLQPQAFTAENMAALLDQSATAYVNHVRGAQLLDGKLRVSSIYKWFQADFGGSDQQVVRHLRRYAKGDLAQKLKTYQGRLRFDYNWNLNE